MAIYKVHSWSTTTVRYQDKALTDRISFKQVAQLSQRDRAAGWVSYGQQWKTGTGRQYLRTI